MPLVVKGGDGVLKLLLNKIAIKIKVTKENELILVRLLCRMPSKCIAKMHQQVHHGKILELDLDLSNDKQVLFL